MNAPEEHLYALVEAVIESDYDNVLRVAEMLDARWREPAALEARVVIPTPYPATRAAWALSEFDRSFRWSLRAAQLSTSVHALKAEGGRPAGVLQGLVLIEVEPGSFLGRLDPSSALESVFKKKTWVIVGGWMTAVALAGWTISEVRQVFHEGDETPPTTQIIYEGPVYNISGTVTLNLGDSTLIITSSTGSTAGDPRVIEAPQPVGEDDEEDVFSPALTRDIPATAPPVPSPSRVADWLTEEGWKVEQSQTPWDFVARRDERVLVVQLRAGRTGVADIRSAGALLDDFGHDAPDAVMVVTALSNAARAQALAAADVLAVYMYRDGRFEPVGPRDPVRG